MEYCYVLQIPGGFDWAPWMLAAVLLVANILLALNRKISSSVEERIQKLETICQNLVPLWRIERMERDIKETRDLQQKREDEREIRTDKTNEKFEDVYEKITESEEKYSQKLEKIKDAIDKATRS